MNRTVVLVLCFIGVLICTTGMVVAEDGSEGELCIPLGVITLAPPEGVESKRSEVEFPHSLHFSINCQQCHHQWEGDEELNSCSAEGCHDLIEAPEKGDGDEPILYYKAAFHESCIGCHKEIKAQNAEIAKIFSSSDARIKPTGPTGCVQCHPKE